MENTVIKEITKKGLDTYFTERQYEALFWALFFPLRNVLTLDFTTLIGEQSGRIAADIIAFDASAPLKTRQVVSKMRGDIPKIATKRQMSEKSILEYNMLSRMADVDENQILDLIYDDLDFVVQAANARMEWLALQAISQTKITLTSSNNNGRVTEEAVDYLMPTANKSGASVIWSAANSATMKPITDIKAIVKKARAKGHQLNYMLMHPDTYDDFVGSDELQSYVKSYYKIEGSDVLPFDDVDAINAALRRARLPEVRVIDQSIGIEGKDGTISYTNPWNAAYCTFIPDFVLGNMLNGPIAEELMPPKQVVQSKSGNVLVSKYSTVDPVSEFTKSEANSFPAWKNVDKCYSIKVTATSWS